MKLGRFFLRHPFFRTLLLLAGMFFGLTVLFWLIGLFLHRLPEPIGTRSDLFVQGARTTMVLTIWSGTLGIFLGIFVGLGKLSDNHFIRIPADFFVSIMRGTPLLVQILFVYFALPTVIPGVRLDEFYSSLLALTLNIAAYNAEAVRAGVLAVPRGQEEAALSLGLSKFQSMRWVVLPQAIKIMVPPFVNNIVSLLKDSSLASTLGLLELSLVGNRVASETFLPVPSLITVALIYLVLTTVLTIFASWIEKRVRFA